MSWVLRKAKRAYYFGQVMLRLGGQYPRTCPICGYQGKFQAFGHPPHYDVQCKRCDALPRHRLLHLCFAGLDLLKPGLKVLHFAPEATVRRVLQAAGVEYISADLTPGRAQLVLNLERIELPDASVDMVVASHVLEHVDDQAALGELHRILRPGGRLIAMVPIAEGWDVSYEDPAQTTTAERDLHFGQGDHVRIYGRDFRERIRAGGFELSEYVAGGDEAVRYGLERGERVFIGLKA